MLKLILIISLFSFVVQAKNHKGDSRDGGLNLESFFNESTLLKGVTYLSQNARHQDEVKLKFKTIQPYQLQWIRGEQVNIEFLDSQRYSNLKHIKMPQAYMQQNQDWLFSNQGCWFSGEQFQSFSQGAIMNLQLERGLFLGKSKSYYYIANEKELEKKSAKATNLNLPEDSGLAVDAGHSSASSKIVREFLPDTYRDFLLEGQELNTDFINQKEKKLQLFSKKDFDQIATVAQGDVPQAAEQEDVMIIENENGIFFDQKSGYVHYYGPVTLEHPEYSLECTGDLKIKLTQKQTNNSNSEAGKKTKNDSGLEYAKAQGKAVLIAWIEQGGERKKVISKGEVIEIFVEEQVIKVQGAYPSLAQDGSILQARDENLSYQIDKEGSLITSKGSWKTELVDLDQN